ncbi:hypothetical protein [Clostridium sp. LIBA-8841]|uniref:hypothetical protein n=1 Tax=Clostridium sp. LIBA-8841 TaxID=2987530 RepID=UPI002AC6CB16|nr:hypothetical protein [Clostridium sp. LIBA-8841]MDZ5252977.1 hypothetical protein [Clostridium sp. LIBA-8841]
MVKSDFKRFSYLLNSQIIRDLKITLGIAIGLMMLNIIWFIYNLNGYLDGFLKKIENSTEILNGGVNTFSSFNISHNRMAIFFTLILLICFCLYCCYLWFREFWGENKSAYTLLNLPISQKLIVLYKVLAAMFFYISLVFFQIVAVIIEYFIFNVKFPKEFLKHESIKELIIYSKINFRYIIPDDYLNIIWLIVSIVALILVAFLFSLLTKSFGIKGGILGAIIGCSLIFIYYVLPSIIRLYSVERFFWMIGTSIVYIIIGWFGSNYLLKNKVHV